MISEIKNSVFTKFLWGFMGIYLLNISVDVADLNPNHISEHLSINDQESIVEIMIEKILGYEDAIQEFDDPDTEDHTSKVQFKIDLFAQSIADSGIKWSLFETTKQEGYFYDSFLTIGFRNLDTPPPKI